MKALCMLTLFAAGLFAQSPTRGCNASWLKGTYGYSVTGLRPAASAPGQVEQVVAVGVRYYDGQGNFTQVQSEKGSLTSAALVDVQSSGTYTVNEDCTGTASGPGPVQAKFVVTDNGKEIRWVVVAPAVVTISGQATRQ